MGKVRVPLSLPVLSFRNSYLGLGILHLILGGFGQGTDPLYAVMRSGYTLTLYALWYDGIDGGDWFENRLVVCFRPISRMCKSGRAISKLVCNF